MEVSNEKYVFERRNPGDKIQWVISPQDIGEHLFTFDGKKVYNLFSDFYKLTKEQRKIFDAENPFWRDFFEGKK